MQTQFNIMKWVVAKCLSINLTIMNETMPSLLDSGNKVSLMWQSYFNHYFWLGPVPVEESDTKAHLFDLKSASYGGFTTIPLVC